MDAAISKRVAEKSNRELGQELPAEEEKLHDDLAPGAKTNELNAWKQFKVSRHWVGAHPKL